MIFNASVSGSGRDRMNYKMTCTIASETDMM